MIRNQDKGEDSQSLNSYVLLLLIQEVGRDVVQSVRRELMITSDDLEHVHHDAAIHG